MSDIIAEAVEVLVQKGIINAEQVPDRGVGIRAITEYIISRNFSDLGPKPNAHKIIGVLGKPKQVQRKEVPKPAVPKPVTLKPEITSDPVIDDDDDIEAEIKKLEDEEKNKDSNAGEDVRA